MANESYKPWLHRWAMLTTLVALLPISVGAVVTTVDAGMAFPDWPTSDGHNMLFYPWFTSVGEQFLEHGHRLAGMVIGVFCIVVACLVAKLETRRWVRGLGYLILAGVIAQGVLGGLRVLVDARVLALVHGFAAALFISMVAALAVITSRRWSNTSDLIQQTQNSRVNVGTLKKLITATVVLLLIQYVLGGMIRHLGLGLHGHIGVAILAGLASLVTVTGVYRSGLTWLRRAAHGLLSFVLVQIGLGISAWITKFGLASIGYVAIYGSPTQVFFRSAHQVCGVLLVTMAVVMLVRASRMAWLTTVATPVDADASAFSSTATGGVG
ncbi:MAG: hypothetical protein CMJ78_20125 [Planctomycetaceae bacterium]|nr:hypothetical protein [Planctomycetaceae bacterium]